MNANCVFREVLLHYGGVLDMWPAGSGALHVLKGHKADLI